MVRPGMKYRVLYKEEDIRREIWKSTYTERCKKIQRKKYTKRYTKKKIQKDIKKKR